MRWRDRLRRWIPPALSEARRRQLGQTQRFSDVDGGWDQAQRQSTGYAAGNIVDRVAAATREVVAGRALYERDSVLFHTWDFPYQIVAALLDSALAHDGRLDVIDVGGSLGSTYRQCLPFLRHVPHLRWHVVEQAGFVEAGRREFSSVQLQFWHAAQEVPLDGPPCFVLLSSVLQYLPEPDQMLQSLLRLPASHLLIDRTPMSALATHRLCVQHVPRSIYEASYPCWVLSRSKLLGDMAAAGWHLKAPHLPGIEGPCRTTTGFGFEFSGLIAERH